MSTGDINAYITCVENLYKIDIDNYVIVNFDSFESIIDALGGVTLELTSAEINEINNHQKRYGNVTIEKTFDGNSGELKLTGAQALAYCRIRKLDSDNARADRQKTCLVEIFDEAKDASNVQLLKIVNSLIPYVKTGFSTNDIVKIAKYAFSDGWLDYDVQMTTVPESRINEKGAGGIYYGAWCWKSDFPQDAYNLQTKIYGKSSITLARLRVDVLQCRETGFFADGNSATTATITNNNYGEVTTLPEEESTTSDEE
jgi:LCP family protein required for cell wall assembly